MLVKRKICPGDASLFYAVSDYYDNAVISSIESIFALITENKTKQNKIENQSVPLYTFRREEK